MEASLKKIVEERLKKLKKLMELGKRPFGHRFERTASLSEIRTKYSQIKAGEQLKRVKVRISGRIVSKRVLGKVCFADLEDRDDKIQLYFEFNTLKKEYEIFKNLIDVGDLIGVSGFVFKTQKGELSVWVESFELLAKSLRPLPHKWVGLKDVELRYRQRYLDLIMNKQMRERALIISKMINAIREFLLEKGFIEVETPALQPTYGGAFAKPFKTFHNFLKQKMYLRIAPELYLKMLIVGNLEKVFEFAKCFRNEAVDATHNPEFTQLELYQAYADYRDTMKLVEEMIAFAAKKVFGKMKINYQGHKLNLRPPWKKMTMVEAIKKYSGIDVLSLKEEEIFKLAKKEGIEKVRWGGVIEGLFEKYAQPKLVQPTFITMFPADITPLAKKSEDPRFAERYEGYIANWEVCNGYTELNNPIEQFKRFKEEEELRKKVKGIEYEPMNRDFVRALEYGMPPTSGVGIGIVRLASIFTNTTSIKEVLLFPTVSAREKIITVCDAFPETMEWFQ